MKQIDREWFKSQFEAAGMSQNKVAEALKIPRSSMSKLLDGERNLKADEAALLAGLIDQPLKEVYARFGKVVAEPEYEPIDITHVIDGFGRMASLSQGRAFAPPVLSLPPEVNCVQFRTRSAPTDYLRGIDGWVVYTLPFDEMVARSVGRWVIAQSSSGQLGVGALARSYENYRHFTITGPVPLPDCEIVAVAPILHMIP